MRLNLKILVLFLVIIASSYITCDAKLGLELNCLKESPARIHEREFKNQKINADSTLELVTMELKEFAFCGDGEIQVSNGEECDDGNKKFADGCSINCLKEISCHFDNQCPSGYCGFSGFCDPFSLGKNN